MSAGRQEKLSSQPPENSNQPVNRFGIVERLRLLAPLHRRAALRRAAQAAGLDDEDWRAPSLDDLALAEAPPDIQWQPTLVGSPPIRPLSPADLTAAAEVMRDTGWRASQPIMSVRDLRAAARREAEDRHERRRQAALADSHRIVEAPTPASVAAHQRGLALADQHRPLLSALTDVLTGLDDVIPMSRFAAMPDDEICALAAKRAQDEWQRQMARIDVAHATGRSPTPRTPDDRRLACRVWQRRRLRRQAGLARQHLAMALGTVGRGGAPYADDYSLERWRERQETGRAWAGARVLRTRGGVEVPMAEVVEAGRQAALARLGAVMHGLDDVAEGRGMTAIFITLTLPPGLHPNPTVGRRSYKSATTPTDIDAALRRLWTRFRARLAKSRIAMLGLRVWEPHEDTCPHIHALLYIRADQIDEVDRHLLELCPEPPHHEKLYGPPARVASDLEVIDRSRGKPTTYITKYIRKAISAGSGDGIGPDQYERHRATASERGWRRYALLGVHGIQRTWQRLATAGDREMEGAPQAAVDVRAALDEGRWADALTGLEAIRERGTRPRIRLTYDDRLTAYGDTARRAVALTDTGTGWSLPLSRGAEVVRIPKQTEARNDSEINEVTVAITCPRAGTDAPAMAAPTLGYDGRGTVYDLETNEIVDEIPASPLTRGPPGYVPDPDRAANDDYVDTDANAEAA